MPGLHTIKGKDAGRWCLTPSAEMSRLCHTPLTLYLQLCIWNMSWFITFSAPLLKIFMKLLLHRNIELGANWVYDSPAVVTHIWVQNKLFFYPLWSESCVLVFCLFDRFTVDKYSCEPVDDILKYQWKPCFQTGHRQDILLKALWVPRIFLKWKAFHGV